ncbi:MAG TPA: hypothetical protein PKV72_00450 [Candidatus Peribacteria bacterium]|nr:hypothetical protein [Candidatus Peribacteria bacterium]
MLSSDDDFELSLSTQKGMEAGSARKQKGLAEKLRKDGKDQLAKQAIKIDNSAKLQSLRAQLDGLKAAQDKKDKDSKQEQKNAGKAGTKTREQELAQAKESAADVRPDAAQMAKQGEQEHKATEEQRREEVTTEGG